MATSRRVTNQRVTNIRLAGFSRRLKGLIDTAQGLRDEINRALIATASTAAEHGAGTRRRTHQSRVKR
jgi:hypothetical protein